MSFENLAVVGLVLSLSSWLTRRLLLPVSRLYLLDHPNERSLHAAPIPRTGGLAILGSLAVGLLLEVSRASFGDTPGGAYTEASLWISAMLLLIAAVSFWDDRTGVSPGLRLGVHVLAAAGVVVGARLTIEMIAVPLFGAVPLGWMAAPLTIVGLIWMTNLYNFMDGMDGFAGGMTVIGFGFLSFLAWADGHFFIALLSLLTAGAAGGFLFYNMPPAQIFMGDVGSILLGFMAGALAVMGIHNGLFDLWVPVLIFSPFIVDATATLIRRLLRRERIWQAHREHYYQRLVLSGWSHRRTVLAECGLMIACGISAIAYSHSGEAGRLALLVAWVLIYAGLEFGVRVVERRARIGGDGWAFGKVKQIRTALSPHRRLGASSSGQRYMSTIAENPEVSIRSQPWRKRLLTKELQSTLDLAVLAAAFLLAYTLRFEFEIPGQWFPYVSRQLAYVILLQFAALNLAGVHSFIWRYIGMAEMRAFLSAAWWSFLLIVMLRLGLPEQFHGWRVPLSIIVIDTILAFSGVIVLRLLRRALYERYEKQQKAIHAGTGRLRPVLLIGAGHAGALAVREIEGRGDTDLEVKGFIDDEPRNQRLMIHKVKVLGTTHDLPRLVKELKIDHVVITFTRASRQDMRRIVKVCEQVPVKVRIIPELYEILQGSVEVNRIRDVQIEDLLGREPVRLDEAGMEQLLAGKRVMVTGAGGSIGSELARQAARFAPSSLLLVERAESALFNIDCEMRGLWPGLSVVPLVADVGDESRMRSIFAGHQPQVVIQAAAHKHVPLMEFNSGEATKNNVLGTHTLGELAGEFGVEVFVLISTDKAVRPTSVMGATKRVAELVVQDLDRRYQTRYVAVRFGNVIGSAGSVIPTFREQILRGGPVTVTHPDMMRYFMTIPEAAQLVLQAGAIGSGGEIFILDMGEPVRILDLAKDTITLSGLKPYEDIDIVFTGLRPGEKLFEELQTTDEQVAKTRHPKIFIGKIAGYPEERVAHALQYLAAVAKTGQEQELRRFLNELLPEARLEFVKETTTKAKEEDSIAPGEPVAIGRAAVA